MVVAKSIRFDDFTRWVNLIDGCFCGIVEALNAMSARIFGSVLRGKDTEGRYLDIRIDPIGRSSLFDTGALCYELKNLLGMQVDVLTLGAQSDKFRARISNEARSV